MRHLKKGRKFSRKTDQRRAFMKSLASSFFISGRICTTEARARELRPFVERVITRAKNPTLANRRILASTFAESLVPKIISASGEFANRQGGYTRIIKMGVRKGDGAPKAVLELVK